jgi:Uncharacterized protein conserved in archaea
MNEDLNKKTYKYERMLREALGKIKKSPNERSYLMKVADDFLNMADSYYRDGIYFLEKENIIDALASFSYGHAWLDAGMRLGIFKSNDEDYELFTI